MVQIIDIEHWFLINSDQVQTWSEIRNSCKEFRSSNFLVGFVKSLCITNIPDSNSGFQEHLEAFTSNRLILLNKNPGLQLTGFGEVLRQILGKKVMCIAERVHKNSAGALQVCACQEAGPEAAENAVNSINRKAMLHNKQKMQFSIKDFFSKCEQICSCSDISITCPIIATFILNCYMEPAISFVAEKK